MCRPTKRPKPLAVAPMMPLKVEESEPVFSTFADAGKDLDTFVSLADLLSDGSDDLFLATPMAENAVMDASADARPKTFVFTAFEMVSNLENANAVGFNAEGTALEIRDLALLSESVLPKYFRHKNVTSFYRQLNSYGFRTVRSSTAEIAHTFSHELFRRDRPDLLNNIVRKKCCPKEKKAIADKAKKSESSGTDSDSTSPAASSSSSPDVSCFVTEAPAIAEMAKLQFQQETVAAVPTAENSEDVELEAARLNQRKAKERMRALESRNRDLAKENKSILMESERIFEKMNLLVEAQTAAIASLFGSEASKAFAEQAKPFRFDFEQHPSIEKVAPQIQSQAQDFNEFVGETNQFLFQDDELQMLENIFTVDSSEILA